jgi:hypothetical protein
MKERILELLAQGLSMSIVSSIVGCSVAYVSSLVKEDEFKEKLAEAKKKYGEQPAEDTTLDNHYRGMERSLLRAMEDALPSAELSDITSALRVVSDRQIQREKIKNPVPANPVIHQNIVQLQLPAHMIQQLPSIQLNSNRQVEAVNGKAMAPMASSALRSLFERKRAEREANELQIELAEPIPARQTAHG